jgi:hypothetical protein
MYFPKKVWKIFWDVLFSQENVDIAPPPPLPPFSGRDVPRGGGEIFEFTPQPDIARYVPGSGKRPINKLVDAVLILCTVAL